MKNKYKQIHFFIIDSNVKEKEDRLWEIVNNKTRRVMGFVEYSNQQKDYVLNTILHGTIEFNISQLLDIVDFIKQLAGTE